MRNPERLDKLYDTLKEVHKELYPDLRFGQFISIFIDWVLQTEKCADNIYYPEDYKWVTWMKEFRDKGGHIDG